VKIEWNKFISNTKPDVVILQDYNKGFLTQDLINFILESCQKNKIKVCVDPKKDNFFAYKNVDLFKPNIKELSEGLGVHINTQDEHSIQSAISLLESKINPQSILLTLSEKGVWYQAKSKSVKVNAHLRNIADVSGAGDTVISIAALCLALNLDAQILAEMSNLGGGLVCEKIGVVSVDKIELKREFNRISV
jgi:rfaE bifunctional protein kinase chain/domain